MRKELAESLDSRNTDYLSIGITERGIPITGIPVPWEKTTSGFNMRIPEIWMSPEDLEDPQVLERLTHFKVRGCYIYTQLRDYSVIGRFTELWDLFICRAGGLRDLSFMKELHQWFMLYIEGADLADISPAFPKNWRDKGLRSYCVGFVNCRIDDIRPMEQPDVRLYELLIWNPRDDRGKAGWSGVRASCFTYRSKEKR